MHLDDAHLTFRPMLGPHRLTGKKESSTFAPQTNQLIIFWFNSHNNHKFIKIHCNEPTNPLPDHW